jgi:hypothetical protein
MIYVFEGARNSGKTFLSDHISNTFGIRKYKFDFFNYFKDLNLSSENSRETHFFAIGKELMLMQISRDLSIEDFILDRGIITVFSWALLEKRISIEEVKSQIKMICEKNLLKGISLIYIEGINPNKESRNKDHWDHLDFDSDEKYYCDLVIKEFKNNGFDVFRFNNSFTEKDKEDMESFFKSLNF